MLTHAEVWGVNKNGTWHSDKAYFWRLKSELGVSDWVQSNPEVVSWYGAN